MNYEHFNLNKSILRQLGQSLQKQHLKLLHKYIDIIKGGLGKFPFPPLEIKTKDNLKPFNSKPYPIPQSQIPAVKKEIERMVQFNTIEECLDSPYISATFAIPKRNGLVQIVTDLRMINMMSE